jgi:PLP dependent protein
MDLSIAERLNNVRRRIQNSTNRAERPEGAVTLLAVSKKQPAEALLEAYAAGVRDFGESYVQEAVAKQEALRTSAGDIVWHFIGPIQSNKTKWIASQFDWLHSIDRFKIAERLSEQRPPELPPLNVCIQINIDAEDSKSGIDLVQLPELAQQIASLPHLKLRGLMAIPRPDATDAERRQSFAALQTALRALRENHSGIDTLSIGMSDDLELAIEYGSTMVRVGTALFGERV